MSSELGVDKLSLLAQSVLQMPDILDELFAVCPIETQDVATRVCTVWRCLTLGPVWREVWNPLKLLNALSPLDSDHKNFITIPSADDWKLFKPIALGVRALHCCDDWPITSAIAKDLLFATWIPKPMFPGLETVTWELMNNSQVFELRCLHTFLFHPGLSSLSLHGIPMRSAENSLRYSFQHFARDVVHLAPNLTHLTITARVIPTSSNIALLDPVIAYLLRHLPRLRMVKMSPCFLTTETYKALLCANDLESLVSYVHVNKTSHTATAGDVSRALDFYLSPDIQESAFRSLTDITICMPIEMATALLSNPHFPAGQLTRLSVRLTGSYSPVTQITRDVILNGAVEAFLTTFSSRCRCVKRLFVALDSPYWLTDDDDAMDLLDVHTLAPIRQAVQLEELIIRDSRSLFGISEDELLHIMEPLIELHTLWIVPTPHWATETSAPLSNYTMFTAQRLIDGHPKLKNLGIYVDLLYEFNERIADPAPGPLEVLFLGTSPHHEKTSYYALTLSLAMQHRVMPLKEDSWIEWGFNKGDFEVGDITEVLKDGWMDMRFGDLNNEDVMGGSSASTIFRTDNRV